MQNDMTLAEQMGAVVAGLKDELAAQAKTIADLTNELAAAKDDNARLRRAIEASPSPAKLRLLADWIDMIDAERGVGGTEVQDDLRRWADALAGMDEKEKMEKENKP